VTVTIAMHNALQDLNQALDSPRVHGALGPWRKAVGDRISFVRDCLTREGPVASEGWLADRSRQMARERHALLARVLTVSARLEQSEVDLLRMEIKRLMVDINHHVQRLHDLAYDDVEMEIGGSE
jgi:hypothetical protein